MRRAVLRKTLKLHPELLAGAFHWSPWCPCEICLERDFELPEDDPELIVLRRAANRLYSELFNDNSRKLAVQNSDPDPFRQLAREMLDS